MLDLPLDLEASFFYPHPCIEVGLSVIDCSLKEWNQLITLVASFNQVVEGVQHVLLHFVFRGTERKDTEDLTKDESNEDSWWVG